MSGQEFPAPVAGRMFLARNTTRKVHFAYTQGRALLCLRKFQALYPVSTLPVGSRLDEDPGTRRRLLLAGVKPEELCLVCFCDQFRSEYAEAFKKSA